MMSKILIAHRGNIAGPQPELENTIPYIQSALKHGFDCEIDVRWVDGEWWLGHDEPQERIDFSYMCNSQLWVHLKNLDAAREMSVTHGRNKVNYFWHQADDIVITSKDWLWTYPGRELTDRSIAVLPEAVDDWNIDRAAGICSNYIGRFV